MLHIFMSLLLSCILSTHNKRILCIVCVLCILSGSFNTKSLHFVYMYSCFLAICFIVYQCVIHMHDIWSVSVIFLLQEHEVDKMFPLRPGRLPVNTVQNIVFITRPKLSLMELVAQNVLKLVAATDASVKSSLLPPSRRSCLTWHLSVCLSLC